MPLACASSMIARYTFGWSFGTVAVPIVDPDLHERARLARAARCTCFAALLLSRGAVRNAQASLARRTRHRGCRDPFPDGEKARRIRDHLVAQPIGELLIGLEPHAQRRGDAVVRVALELVDEVLARVVRLAVAAVALVDQPDVVVAVDERRDDRLAGQVDAGARPAAAAARPCLPTQVKVSPSTRNAEFSIGALPSPTMSRAPSNQNASFLAG